LEETADLIGYNRRIELEAVIDHIKDRFQTNNEGVKKIKRETSDDEENE
jgi:hypothetical protein